MAALGCPPVVEFYTMFCGNQWSTSRSETGFTQTQRNWWTQEPIRKERN